MVVVQGLVITCTTFFQKSGGNEAPTHNATPKVNMYNSLTCNNVHYVIQKSSRSKMSTSAVDNVALEVSNNTYHLCMHC